MTRRQVNGWTTEMQECYRLVSRKLEDPRQLRIDGSAPWEKLPYHCRIDWTKEGTEVLMQRSLAYKRRDTGGGRCCTQDRGNYC